MDNLPYIEGENRGQIHLLPEVIEDYITEDSIVRVIEEYVNQLDMRKLGFKKAFYPTSGRPPYNPKDILKLYLYGYLNRITSSRRLEHETHRNLEVIWLLKKLKPDFKTIADFRKDNKKPIKGVFRDFNKLCNEWGLFGKELVAVDGTKIRACNSKRNNYSKKKLDRHIKYVDEKIEKYIEELDKTDEAESCNKKPDAKEIQKRLKELKNRRVKYETLKEELKETGKTEISATDPDARLMSNNNNTVDISYNLQAAVDAKNKMFTDFKITQKPNDLGELDNMAVRTKRLFQGKGFKILADKGYYLAKDLKRCVEEGITPYITKQTYSNGTGDRDFYSDKFKYRKDKNIYICPSGKELYYDSKRRKSGEVIGYDYRNFAACQGCKFMSRCTRSKKGRSIFRHIDQDFLDTVDVQTQVNMEIYKQRQMIVEHPFGTIKRNWGAYYFLTKRKASVSTEAAFLCLSYNMKRAMNILGVEEILKRLRKRAQPVFI